MDVKHEPFELLASPVLLHEPDERAACRVLEGQSLRMASHLLGWKMLMLGSFLGHTLPFQYVCRLMSYTFLW